jgi:hypothetical protein
MNAIRNRRGAVAAMSAIVMIGVVAFAGLAIDLTRIWMVNARLKTAIDAASLVAARQISVPQPARDALVTHVFWANYNQNGRGNNNYLRSVAYSPTITQLSDTRIQVSAFADVPTTLFSIVDRSIARVTDSAIAQRQGIGLELALVLDVTGSLGVTNMVAVRNAATDLVNILYGPNERQPDLWVSVVPYTATVNIGRGRGDWLEPGSLNPANYLPTVWRGCVEARAGAGYAFDADQDDTPPSVMRFRPHYWASNRTRYSHPLDTTNPLLVRFDQVLVNAGNIPRNRGDNSWIPTRIQPVPLPPTDRDHPWWNTDPLVPAGQVWEPNPENPDSDAVQDARGNHARGPNLGCPRAVLPLTRDKTPILQQIAALRHTHRGGTMANLGLQLGWGTLSPRWRADWNLGEFRDGQQLPLDYNTRNMRKAIVLMTDGNNEWYDWPDGAPGACSTTGNTSNAAYGIPNAAGGVACVATAAPLTQAQTLAILNRLPLRLPINLGAPNPIDNESTWSVSGNSIRTTPDDGDVTAYGRLRTNRMGVANATIGTARTDPVNGIDARMVRLCQAVRANDRNITVYTITFGAAPNASTRSLYENCASTPGNYFHAPTTAVLSSVFQTIAGQLANLRLLE